MGPGGFFPTNPDLADILGRTDFDFEIFFAFWIPNFQISRFPDFQKSGLGLGPGWAPRLGRAGPLGWAGGSLGWGPGEPLRGAQGSLG